MQVYRRSLRASRQLPVYPVPLPEAQPLPCCPVHPQASLRSALCLLPYPERVLRLPYPERVLRLPYRVLVPRRLYRALALRLLHPQLRRRLLRPERAPHLAQPQV